MWEKKEEEEVRAIQADRNRTTPYTQAVYKSACKLCTNPSRGGRPTTKLGHKERKEERKKEIKARAHFGALC